MTQIRDKSLFYFLTAISSVIALLLGMLFSAPPLVAEDSAPLAPVDINSQVDSQFEGMLGGWEGNLAVMGKKMLCAIDISMDLNGQWLKMNMIGYTDSARQEIGYQAYVYMRPSSVSGEYRAYLVDNAGSGQLGTATVANGVWSWVWEYDDGTHETGTMVTSLPNRLTYESQVIDKFGNPLAAIEFDLNKSSNMEQVKR